MYTTLMATLGLQTCTEHAAEDNQWNVQNKQAQCEHNSKPTCDRQLIFDYYLNGKVFLWYVHHVLLLMHIVDWFMFPGMNITVSDLEAHRII